MNRKDVTSMEEANAVFCPRCGLVGTISRLYARKPCPECSTRMLWITSRWDPEVIPAVVKRYGKVNEE